MKELTIDDHIGISKQLDDCYANAFGKGGKTVLSDLKEYCHEGESAYHDDARREAFNLGVQSVMIYVNDRLSKRFTKELLELKEQENKDE